MDDPFQICQVHRMNHKMLASQLDKNPGHHFPTTKQTRACCTQALKQQWVSDLLILFKADYIQPQKLTERS
jgi:hypothetical protein